jgi:hypothetical protein
MEEFGQELPHLLEIMRQSYLTHSVITEATNSRVYNEISDRTLSFKDIVITETVPRDWFDNPAVCPEPFFYDIGHNLAIAEENFLVRAIKENTEAQILEIPEIIRRRIFEIISEFVYEGNNMPVLFVPAELSVPLYVDEEELEFEDNHQYMRISPMARAQLLPTSKYIELNDLIVIDKTTGTWIYRPGNYNSLAIRLAEVGFGNLKITAQINAAYKTDRPRSMIIIHLTHRP